MVRKISFVCVSINNVSPFAHTRFNLLMEDNQDILFKRDISFEHEQLILVEEV